jgi:hypothetical protein
VGGGHVILLSRCVCYVPNLWVCQLNCIVTMYTCSQCRFIFVLSIVRNHATFNACGHPHSCSYFRATNGYLLLVYNSLFDAYCEQHPRHSRVVKIMYIH